LAAVMVMVMVMVMAADPVPRTRRGFADGR
jgi:hypothetical protein